MEDTVPLLPKKSQSSSNANAPSPTPNSIPLVQSILKQPGGKKQPNRTTKTNKKLVLFPSETPEREDADNVSEYASEYANDDDLFSSQQVALGLHSIDPAARPTAYNTNTNSGIQHKTKKELPRVTGYTTANSYQMDHVLRWLRTPPMQEGCQVESVRRVDEVIWMPYVAPLSVFETLSSRRQVARKSRQRDKFSNVTLDAHPQGAAQETVQDQLNARGEIFIFEYGVVVMWNLTLPQEQHFLSMLTQFEEEKLNPENVETEEFRFVYRDVGTARIYNDVITLRSPMLETIDESGQPPSQYKYNHQSQDSMIKLTISHAIAQSVKLTLFEGRIEDTIESFKDIPLIMAKTGRVPMSRSHIIKKIGHLFVMRINVNLVSPILDTPELFWSLPNLEPLYAAARTYLEISQRVDLVNQRVAVLSDLLEMLKEHLNSMHSEYLEWIIIALIFIEILIGLVTIAFDFYNLYHK